jgi:hypothetical protein
MQAASQLLILILGGLFLGQWLVDNQHWPGLTVVLLPIVGFVLGMLMLYKQSLIETQNTETEKIVTQEIQTEQNSPER